MHRLEGDTLPTGCTELQELTSWNNSHVSVMYKDYTIYQVIYDEM